MTVDEGRSHRLTENASTEELARGREASQKGSERPSPGHELERGEHVGPYRIQRRIGRGGMGDVYEAEQLEPVRRRVALKVIRWGMDSDEVVARFETERQALALMDHPNIAHVLDAGATDHGRPYFVMELVKGVPLHEYCDTQRLGTRQRLELFMLICEAVQHAHQKGIIHRDLKPTNVLVETHGDRAVPKIIDFGVAKATSQKLTEHSVFTEFGQLIGTPEFMSPEQAEMSGLDVDTRTDVYALGVVLYWLLTGALPFEPEELRAGGFDEIRRKIREDEPLRPSTRLSTLGDTSVEMAAKRRSDPTKLSRRLRGDLDWIVMKALEKDRTRRYGSASEMAADVGRHLRDEPVLACPPTSAYRIRKFVARHRGAVVSATVLLFLLVAFSIAVSVQSVMIYRAQQVAEENLRLAQDAVDQTLTELGSEELANVPQMAAVRRRILETARTFYLEFRKREPSDPDLRMDPALAHRRLGDISRLESDIEAADAEYRTAIEMLTTLVAQYPERPDYRDALAHTHNMRGELLRGHEERRPEAAAAYDEALEIQSALVEQLAGGRLPNGQDPRVALARTYNNRGILLDDSRDYVAAEMSYRGAIDVLEEIPTEGDGSSADHRLELSRVYNNVGALYDQTGRSEDARTAFELAVTHLETLVAGDPDKRLYRLELSKSSNNLAYLLFNSGMDLGDALDVNDKALDSFIDLARPIPEISGEHGHAHWVRGVILRNQGAEREAQLAFERSIEIYRDLTAAPSDYAQGSTFHLRFAWVRWVESPAPAASLGGLSSRDRGGVCGDYAWLATVLSGEEIASVMMREDYSAAADVLSECSRLSVGAGNGGGAASGGASRYEQARQALGSKFNGQGVSGS